MMTVLGRHRLVPPRPGGVSAGAIAGAAAEAERDEGGSGGGRPVDEEPLGRQLGQPGQHQDGDGAHNI